MNEMNETRRKFMAFFAGAGLGSTLLPGLLWGRMLEASVQRVTAEMLSDALAMAGLDFSPEEQEAMLQGVNQNLERYEPVRRLKIPNDVSLPVYFTTIVPGMAVERARRPFRISDPETVTRPVNLEEVAFWPVRRLAELIRTRQVTSVELTEMYLGRLHRHNATLNNVVTFLDELGLQQAREADAEIAAGRYRGPLHGIPWGAKDIIAAKGYKTTWGSDAYKNQVIDMDATVVELLRDAGAVLIAKLCTGEIAHGDRHLLGQTMNPWNPTQGSGGSSCGPGSATAAGGVGFSIGTETSGSILGPSRRCGVTGLRPTFGRISRYGVMVVSWTQDRLGPMCRYAEDCALVMNAVARPDGRDLSVSDIPFNWDAGLDIRSLRVGYIPDGFDNASGAMAENAGNLLEQLRSLGVRPVPMNVPDFPYFMSSYQVEESVFQNEIVIDGRAAQMTRANLANGLRTARMISAVDYLVSQRARMMMMSAFAEATAGFDVWIATTGGEGGEATSRNSNFANLSGYPALNIHNGFDEEGNPTAVVFFGRPFGEDKILALGKAYQDAARFHTRSPNLA